jgi:hypothetical protein
LGVQTRVDGSWTTGRPAAATERKNELCLRWRDPDK